jgi:pimeloyl-ACP methyl ester carboxylesterase
MDTLGFGESDPPPRYFSVHDYAATVIEFADRLGVRGPLTLLGHHTGAAVAVEVAASWPARVSKLVLVGVPLFMSADARRKRWEERGVEPIVPTPDAEHVLRVWRGLEALSPDADVSLRHRELVDALKAPRYDQAYRAVLLEYDCDARLRLVGCPTLIVAGTREPLFGSQEAAARFVPRSTLAIVQGGGTFMLDERTEQVAQLVLRFLGVPSGEGPAPDRP